MELSERASGGLETADVLERIRSYAAASRADNTWRAYQSDLRHFAAWCAEHGIADPVPALLDTLSIDDAHNLAHSSGSVIALQLASIAKLARRFSVHHSTAPVRWPVP